MNCSGIVATGLPNITNTCTCPATNTNWVINLADNCVISTPCDIGTGNLSTTGTGNPFQINSTLWVNRLINWTNFILMPITGNSLGQRGQ